MTKTNTPIATATMAAAASIIMLMATPMLLFQGALAAPTLRGPITCTIIGATQLNCMLNVLGLSGAKFATAILTATATVGTTCTTPSGSNENGFQTSTTTVSTNKTVNVQGGKATFDLTTPPLNAEQLRTCQSANMTPTIVCITFSNISIEVVPNSGPSKTFSVPGTLSNCPT